MTASRLDILRRLEPTAGWLADLQRYGGEVVPAGPFCALLHSRALGLNYAAPTEPLGPLDAIPSALADLRRIFAERGLTPEIEFNEPLFPELPPILQRTGFMLDNREPLLVLEPADFRPETNPAVHVRFLQPDDAEADLIAYRAIFNAVLLDRPRPPTLKGIARLRQEIEQGQGRCHAQATLDGRPVGIGFVSAADGVAELTRVGTVPEARRQGVAATLTGFIVDDRFRAGDTLAWLTASGEPAQRLYQKLGFRLLGDRLYYRAAPTASGDARGAPV
jgi:ribosomal protein S18 acetylase RimI-like enzyme